jgi:hypothetical protein
VHPLLGLRYVTTYKKVLDSDHLHAKLYKPQGDQTVGAVKPAQTQVWNKYGQVKPRQKYLKQTGGEELERGYFLSTKARSFTGKYTVHEDDTALYASALTDSVSVRNNMIQIADPLRHQCEKTTKHIVEYLEGIHGQTLGPSGVVQIACEYVQNAHGILTLVQITDVVLDRGVHQVNTSRPPVTVPISSKRMHTESVLSESDSAADSSSNYAAVPVPARVRLDDTVSLQSPQPPSTIYRVKTNNKTKPSPPPVKQRPSSSRAAVSRTARIQEKSSRLSQTTGARIPHLRNSVMQSRYEIKHGNYVETPAEADARRVAGRPYPWNKASSSAAVFGRKPQSARKLTRKKSKKVHQKPSQRKPGGKAKDKSMGGVSNAEAEKDFLLTQWKSAARKAGAEFTQISQEVVAMEDQYLHEAERLQTLSLQQEQRMRIAESAHVRIEEENVRLRNELSQVKQTQEQIALDTAQRVQTLETTMQAKEGIIASLTQHHNGLKEQLDALELKCTQLNQVVETKQAAFESSTTEKTALQVQLHTAERTRDQLVAKLELDGAALTNVAEQMDLLADWDRMSAMSDHFAQLAESCSREHQRLQRLQGFKSLLDGHTQQDAWLQRKNDIMSEFHKMLRSFEQGGSSKDYKKAHNNSRYSRQQHKPSKLQSRYNSRRGSVQSDVHVSGLDHPGNLSLGPAKFLHDPIVERAKSKMKF